MRTINTSFLMMSLIENIKIYNLGTGKGYSVLEMVTAFEKASGKKVKLNRLVKRIFNLT